MFYKDKLICGIQIKPTTYETSNSYAVAIARYCNEGKNFNYRDKFDVPTITITSETNGEITSHYEKLRLDRLYKELP